MKQRIKILAIAIVFSFAAMLSGCGSGASSAEPIKLATKPMTEQFIIGEMIKLVVEDNTDYTVDITKGIGGGTGNIQPAMEKGDFDMYPEYTSTAWQYVLKHTDIPPYEQLFTQLQQEYIDEYGFEWVGMYGFSDTFGLAVRKELAEKYGLTDYSSLAAAAPEMIFAAEPDFYERDDGYDALCAAYGLKFKENRDLDIGLKYPAINSGKVDVMDIFTTDGQLSTSDVTVLTDDKNFFIDAYCGTVVRSDSLKKYPGLKEALQKLEGAVSTEEMSVLNHTLENEGKDEADIAKDFLKAKGIVS